MPIPIFSMTTPIRRAPALCVAVTASPLLLAQECVPAPRSLTGWWTYDPKLTPKGWPPGQTPWEGPACIGRHHSYLDRTAGDDEGHPTEEEFRAMARGNARRDERRRQVRAVGKFIAANSDLLIALPESGDALPDIDRPVDLTECGTPAIS